MKLIMNLLILFGVMVAWTAGIYLIAYLFSLSGKVITPYIPWMLVIGGIFILSYIRIKDEENERKRMRNIHKKY